MKIVSAGDAALVLELDERIDPVISGRCSSIAERLAAENISGIRDIVPTYRSVAVYFDPLRIDQAKLRSTLDTLTARATAVEPVRRDPIRIPVCYDADCGPDLGSVAKFAGLSEADVIEIHSAATYRVMMLGFMPGFAYMGVVDPRIAAPRLDTPRQRVPRGSVGIAKDQTGIYPSETPGGWQVIGRTPVRPFDLTQPDPFLLHSGDEVRFVPIAREEFDRALSEVEGHA